MRGRCGVWGWWSWEMCLGRIKSSVECFVRMYVVMHFWELLTGRLAGWMVGKRSSKVCISLAFLSSSCACFREDIA